jgi:hypothetical protein
VTSILTVIVFAALVETTVPVRTFFGPAARSAGAVPEPGSPPRRRREAR